MSTSQSLGGLPGDGVSCGRPGCAGVVEDGYCNICGLLPVTSSPTPTVPSQPEPTGPSDRPVPGAAPGPSTATATDDGAPCTRPDCKGGTIEDGYCNLCGFSATSAVSVPNPSVPNPSSFGPSGSGHPATGSPGTGDPGTSSPAGSGPLRHRRSRPSRPTPSRGRLGAGIITVADVAVPDPTSMVLANPQVPERGRYCAICDEPVGRARGDSPGRLEGFCANCRQPFSFVPKLAAGDVVSQYEVVGCLAFGGQGWVYLARDRNVAENFWVVLKGLLNTHDPQAMTAAIAERQFLAAVDHSNIVKIFSFVEWQGTGYIVMEYIGGMSLLKLLKQRRATAGGQPDPLPVTQAIAYILGILPAFAYLHRQGLVYCDFKPDNVMLSGDSLKLIDLGAVRRIDDPGPSFATPGYQAPEVPTLGPSVASDLFTIGRSLAALILDFRGNTTTYAFTIPPQRSHEVLARHDSLYRFLLRTTAPDPDARFLSADEMFDELLGVLREIVAIEQGRPNPAPSRRFGADAHLTGEKPDGSVAGPAWSVLPVCKPDPDDPATPTLVALPDAEPDQLTELLSAMGPTTPETQLRLARAWLETGRADRAQALLASVADEDPYQWRTDWYQGLLVLDAAMAARAAASGSARGFFESARDFFDRVYGAVPGELAPKLALALATETIDPTTSARMFDVVSRTDPSFTSASFGLARVRYEAGDLRGAVEAWQRVPRTSAAYLAAQTRIIRAMVDRKVRPGRAELDQASRILDSLRPDPQARAELALTILEVALEALEAGTLHPGDDVIVVGRPLHVRDLRFGLEEVYRRLAQLATARPRRIAMVEAANRVRPRTLV